MKKPLFPSLGAAAVLPIILLVILLGCTKPSFTTFSDMFMTTEAMQAELDRLHQLNLTVADGDFDPSRYPIAVGLDSRNGKMLVEKFICWDDCPKVGMVFLLYREVNTLQDCLQMGVGTPLFSPDPIPGQYWGCRPVIDWLNLPERSPG